VLEKFGEFYVMLLELELVKHYVHMCRCVTMQVEETQESACDVIVLIIV